MSIMQHNNNNNNKQGSYKGLPKIQGFSNDDLQGPLIKISGRLFAWRAQIPDDRGGDEITSKISEGVLIFFSTGGEIVSKILMVQIFHAHDPPISISLSKNYKVWTKLDLPI